MMKTIKERIQSKVTISQDGCWVWTGAKFVKGYGQIVTGGLQRRAHIVAYEEWVGPVPLGLELDHLCRVTLCVNPEHLEPVTHAENMARSEPTTRTHCPHNHRYTLENTYRYPDGRRECRTCKRARANGGRAPFDGRYRGAA